MRYKELLQEKVLGKDHFRNINVDLGNFYANIDNLKASGKAAEITDKFQSIDALTRLGLFATKEFRLMPLGTEQGAAGAYNPSREDIRLAMDLAVSADKKAAGTTTFMHELRHSAFNIISQTNSLVAMLPDDMQSKWRDGWGNRINHDKWTISVTIERDGRPETFDIQANPEHCLIYAVQFADPMANWKRVFFTEHPLLKDYDIDYWRDLYNQTNDAVAEWLRTNVEDGRVMQGTFPSKGSSRDSNRSGGMNLSINPKVLEWYKAVIDSYEKPGGGYLRVFFQQANYWNRRYRHAKMRTITPELAKDIASMEELFTALEKGYLSEVPKWYRKNQDNPGRNTRHIRRKMREFAFSSDANIPWDDLDIRKFTKDEIDTAVSTGELPKKLKPKTAPKSKPRNKPKTAPNKTVIEIEIKVQLEYIDHPAAAKVARRNLEKLAEKHGLDKSAIDGLIELYKQKKAESYRSNVLAWAGV